MNTGTNAVEPDIERLKAAFKRAGLKLTHQRLEIFREIASSIEHPDAIGVYNSLKERLPTVSLDTVYRTLWTLNELGLVHVLGTGKESARFDANLERHHHFVCTKCGLVRDFVNDEFNSLEVHDEVLQFGRVLNTQIEVHGICNSCSHNSE